jgi:hypothetical protein
LVEEGAAIAASKFFTPSRSVGILIRIRSVPDLFIGSENFDILIRIWPLERLMLRKQKQKK